MALLLGCETGEILGDRLDVGVRESSSHGGHDPSRIVVTCPGLPGLKGIGEIGVPLAGEVGGRLWNTDSFRSVAICARLNPPRLVALSRELMPSRTTRVASLSGTPDDARMPLWCIAWFTAVSEAGASADADTCL